MLKAYEVKKKSIPNHWSDEELCSEVDHGEELSADADASGSPYYINKFKGPAVLVESGFISNASDRRRLQNQSGQIGKEIATGITNYLKP